jgi:hypothetical protein
MAKIVSLGNFYLVIGVEQAAGARLFNRATTVEAERPARVGFGWLVRLPFTGARPTLGVAFGRWRQ